MSTTTTTPTALYLTSGALASTEQGHSLFGYYWILNDTAAAALGRRTVSAWHIDALGSASGLVAR